MLTLQIQNHLNMADNLEFSINREGDLWKKLLCDTREADETVTLYSNNLEFSTKLYFDTIVESLKKSCNQLYVYDNPKEFMDNIAIHKNDIVFSAIWTS